MMAWPMAMADMPSAVWGPEYFSRRLGDEQIVAEFDEGCLDPDHAQIDAVKITGWLKKAEMAVDASKPKSLWQTIQVSYLPFLRTPPIGVPHEGVLRVNFPILHPTITAVIRAHTLVQLCRAANALDLFRSSRGSFPATLAELVPTLLDSVPKDPFDGKEVRYRRTAADRYQLYSIGWDSKDDGGTPTETGRLSGSGDWVWSTGE